MLYLPLSSPKAPTFGTKPLPRRRFLQHYYRNTFIESPPISHRSPCFVLCLRWFLKVGTFRALRSECVPSHSFRSRNWQSFLQRFTLPFCVVKRCHYFDIFQKNTYKTSINSTFATKTVKNLHMCNFCSTFAAQRSRLNDHGVSRLFEADKPKSEMNK